MERDEDRQMEGGCGHEEPHRADWKGRVDQSQEGRVVTPELVQVRR